MSLNFCDLLVLGSDLSGVVAATLLAKRGMNVLILDDDEEGERTPNMATGLDSRAFKSILSKLMIPESKIQVVQENKVAGQVILPRHRIDLPPSRPALFKEIDREFPTEGEIFREFLSEVDQLREKSLETFLSFLPISSRGETKQFIRWLKTLSDEKVITLWEKFSPTLKLFLKLYLRFLARGPLIEPLTLQLILYLSPEGCNTFSIRGGARELKKVFFEKLDYFGGIVHPLAGDDFEIQAKGREIRAVKLNRYNFPTRCRYLLGNMNMQNFYQHLPRNLWSFWSKKKMLGFHSLEGQFLLQYEISRDHLPGPMKENVVFIEDPAKPLAGINYLEINLSPFSRTDDGRRLLSVTYYAPAPMETDLGTTITLHDEIERRLRKLLPFSAGSLKKVFPRPQVEGELFTDNGDFPTFFKLAQKRKFYPPSFFSPNLSTPFKNGILLGPNLLEWLGMEGKVLSALKGLEIIWEKEAKTKS